MCPTNLFPFMSNDIISNIHTLICVAVVYLVKLNTLLRQSNLNTYNASDMQRCLTAIIKLISISQISYQTNILC